MYTFNWYITLSLIGSQDWGEEASWISWRNDIERRRRQLEAISDDQLPLGMSSKERKLIDKRRRKLSPPKFSQLHFWGFGWWENVVKKKKK